MIALSLAEIAEAVGGELRLAGSDSAETVVDGVVDTDSRMMAAGSVEAAAVVAGAQNVRSSCGERSRRKNRVASDPSVSQPFEPP